MPTHRTVFAGQYFCDARSLVGFEFSLSPKRQSSDRSCKKNVGVAAGRRVKLSMAKIFFHGATKC